MTYTTHQARQN